MPHCKRPFRDAYAYISVYYHGSGKESAISSPVSPLPVRDIMPGQSPVIQTLHDNKQWVDLDYLSPKLIRELCRQYGPPPEQDSTSTISKGAARNPGRYLVKSQHRWPNSQVSPMRFKSSLIIRELAN
ncbi:hypothetical protein BTJ68_14640 [Hortaea werneckii EXF-2000]|uniref:Uncharacterized protein n=1 Tax=Hortaea werneckii EXF-2000 TaxID=1157616 RepID=A0A1Z5SMG6_HORWE|nr:hypothetical protein BTJ68_14640 [Hortaea werneckii EXF-2000]